MTTQISNSSSNKTITLTTDIPEEEIIDKCDRMIDSCITPSQMKFTYNFINQAYLSGAISENAKIYLDMRYAKKAREMDRI